MSLPNLPLVQAHHPATFLERGVAVPFTTPLLMGARVRPAERNGIEIIVPNPSGGRGVYIVPWSGICGLCRPTVHDRRLHELVADRPGITPATMREAARTVALEGLAGQAAAAAAARAKDTDMRDRLATNFLLLMAAIRQTTSGGAGTIQPSSLGELERRAKIGLEKIAPRLGRGPDEIFRDVEHLATVLTPIGMDRQHPPPRVVRLLADISAFRAEAVQWARDNLDSSGAQAHLAAAIAGVTVTCAESTLADARTATADVIGLLKEWCLRPAPVAGRLARSEWLVDGWEQICLLWKSAVTKPTRRAALAEIALLVPVLPKEVDAWLGRQVESEAIFGIPRLVPAHTDWRTGMHLERVARNESLRAMAA
jgi:hypothetical protein